MAHLYVHLTPNGKQWEFFESQEKYVLLLGAAGSGKSVALCLQMVRTALDYPGALCVLFRKSYPALRDTTKGTLLDVLSGATVHRSRHPHTCPGCVDEAAGRDAAQCRGHEPSACLHCRPAWDSLVAAEIKSEGREEVTLTNGSRILFRCLDDYRKLGSTAFDAIGVDEAIEVQEREAMTLIARLRGRIGPRRLWFASNPPDEDHWLFTWFVAQANPDKRVIHSTTYDNRHNLDADYVQQLESYPPAWREKFLFGRWGFLSEGRPVFGEFNPEVHMAEDLAVVPGLPLIRGWDFGFRHPAVVFLQVTTTGHVHVLDELMGTEEELSAFTRRVLERTAQRFPQHTPIEDFCDVAGTQRSDRGPTAVQVLHEFGIFPNYRKYGVWVGVERISYLLRTTVHGVPLLQVATACRILRKALVGGYRMANKKDEPEKDGYYDNVIDALKYALLPSTQGPLTTADPYAGKPLPRTWRLPI